MFELPDAKRVRRDELFGDNASSNGGGSDNESNSETEALRARLNAQIAQSLRWDTSQKEPPALPPQVEGGLPQDEGNDEEGAEEAFEFRLFNTSGDAAKVVLEDDSELKGDGGLARPRPLSHYVVTDVPPRRKLQYQFSAVSGEDVVSRSRQRSWGLELPWKVTTISVTRKAGAADSGRSAGDDEDTATRRKRPGKKRRIILRTRERAKTEKKAAVQKEKEEKEEHIKDKKKRLNRLKKLRRRAKDKEKKAGGGGEKGDGEAGGSDEDMSE